MIERQRYAEAEQYLLEAKELYLRAGGPESDLYLRVLFSYVEVLRAMGREEEADQYERYVKTTWNRIERSGPRHVFGHHTEFWLFRISRATRAIWQISLEGDSLPRRFEMDRPPAISELSTQSAEEPEFCVMAHSRVPLIPELEWIESFGTGSFYTKHGMASILYDNDIEETITQADPRHRRL